MLPSGKLRLYPAIYKNNAAERREQIRPVKLQGVKVIDLSSFLPGPHLTMMMADHGAEVIKIEQPGTGDATRSIGQKQNGHTVYFRNANRGKKSVALDLKAPAGRDALLRLLKDADVLLETFRPGVAKRLGLDYDSVRKVAPQIVYCSISAFGQDGPMRDQPAHDLSVLALSGALSLTGDAERGPALPSIPAADMASSLMALSGILMALLRARQTGEGDYLDISMHDTLVSWMAHLTGSAVRARRIAGADRTNACWAVRRFTASIAPVMIAFSRSADRRSSSPKIC